MPQMEPQHYTSYNVDSSSYIVDLNNSGSYNHVTNHPVSQGNGVYASSYQSHVVNPYQYRFESNYGSTHPGVCFYDTKPCQEVSLSCNSNVNSSWPVSRSQSNYLSRSNYNWSSDPPPTPSYCISMPSTPYNQTPVTDSLVSSNVQHFVCDQSGCQPTGITGVATSGYRNNLDDGTRNINQVSDIPCSISTTTSPSLVRPSTGETNMRERLSYLRCIPNKSSSSQQELLYLQNRLLAVEQQNVSTNNLNSYPSYHPLASQIHCQTPISTFSASSNQDIPCTDSSVTSHSCFQRQINGDQNSLQTPSNCFVTVINESQISNQVPTSSTTSLPHTTTLFTSADLHNLPSITHSTGVTSYNKMAVSYAPIKPSYAVHDSDRRRNLTPIHREACENSTHVAGSILQNRVTVHTISTNGFDTPLGFDEGSYATELNVRNHVNAGADLQPKNAILSVAGASRCSRTIPAEVSNKHILNNTEDPKDSQSVIVKQLDSHVMVPDRCYPQHQAATQGATIHYKHVNATVPHSISVFQTTNNNQTNCEARSIQVPSNYDKNNASYSNYSHESGATRQINVVYSNQAYPTSIVVTQVTSGVVSNQLAKSIPPGSVHPLIPVSCASFATQHCSEGEQFIGLSTGAIPCTYQPILPKTTVTSAIESQPIKRPRGRRPLDPENRKTKRKQQKRNLETEPSVGDNGNAFVDTCRVKPLRPRTYRKRCTETAANNEASQLPSSSVTKNSEADDNLNRKRRASVQTQPGKRGRKAKPKPDPDLLPKVKPIAPAPPNNQQTDNFSVDTPDNLTVSTQAKIVRTRHPRPKKRRPLPTLIRKKKRSAFYGDDSESEPDMSLRHIGRICENRSAVESNANIHSKRRSERTAGDRKRYNVDLDLNLTDDDSNGDEGMVTVTNSTDLAGEYDNKVVESVLGRRITKRLIKKITEIVVNGSVVDHSPSNDNCSTVVKPAQLTMTEEEEEDVEEYYLKYKSYSYLHCEWRALDEITDPRIRPKVRRFEMRQSNSLRTEDDDMILFNPDYVEVERVLDVKIYRNGVLVSLDKTDKGVKTTSTFEIRESKRKRKKETEQHRDQYKTQINKNFASPNTASDSVPVTPIHNSDARSSTPLTEDLQENEAFMEDVTFLAPDSVLSDLTSPLKPNEYKGQANSTDLSSRQPSSPNESSVGKDIREVFVDLPIMKSEDDADNMKSERIDDTGHDDLNCVPDKEEDTSKTIEKHDDGDTVDLDEGCRSPENVIYYLVKWRSLPYEEATWELSQDVDPTKVKDFYRRRFPPKNPPVIRDAEYKIIRPDHSDWKPVTSDSFYKNNNELRDYQIEGVNWLTYCWYHHRNCILADEMGLGKTVQSVAFLLELYNAGIPGPFLVIVPLSTIGNWQREFENWSNLNVVMYHGSSVSRNMIQEYEIFYRKRTSGTPRHDVYKFNVLVTTFEILMSDIEFFGQLHWAAAVIDEAHRLKNKKCKLGEGLRYLDLDHRVLLTGTPLQNNVEELFGLLNFLEPEKFNCSSTFVAEYGELKTEEQVENLKTVLKPMMLRRLKEDVEKSLAPKEETIVEVELTNMQKKYYRAIMERNLNFLCKGSSTANAPNLMNVMMELRKCCNHPYLIKGAEDAILEEMNTQSPQGNEDDRTFQAMVYSSGKLVLIHKLLPKLRADNHKVLIFSQMIRVLDILEDYLVHEGFQFERIDGRIHGPLRQEAIDRFCSDPDKFVFLLCTKAGGLGINLTAADVVIIYDSDWNPQNDLQAQARCHRIGQQKMVKVYRLITRNTYEREMFDRASLKLGLDRAVLQSMGSKEARQAQMSKKEIEDLLKKGAYGALMDDDKAGEEFCEEDIDQILQSRAQVIQLEQGKENSTFSKATFSISDNRSDIELDDPQFWQKWAKKAGVDETAVTIKDLIMKTPRQRRQTNRYSAMFANEPPNIPSPSSFDISDYDDNGNTLSSGDETVVQSSTGRNRGRRNRRQGRPARNSSIVSPKVDKQTAPNVVVEHPNNNNNNSNLIEPLDRPDMFKVERCLLTWPWGQWEQGLEMVQFKRPMKPSELAYFSCAFLSYTLRCLPSNCDTRTRAIIATLARPGTWRLDIHEVAAAVSEATAKINLLMRPCCNVNNLDESVQDCDRPNNMSVNLTDSVIAAQPDTCQLTDTKPKVDCSLPSDNPVDDDSIVKKNEIHATEPDSSCQKNVSTKDEPLDDETMKSGVNTLTSDTTFDPVEHCDKDDDEDEEEEEEIESISEAKVDTKQISPRLACFNPELLLPSESFKKHVQRAGPRLLNRVALLFFLQCEVIGIEMTKDLIAHRLDHTDFSDLEASLPAVEALDSELPAPWWDTCCDKCLLVGIIKHGWEKYVPMRLDPGLCFRSRALAALRLKSEIENETVKRAELSNMKTAGDKIEMENKPIVDVNTDAKNKINSDTVSANDNNNESASPTESKSAEVTDTITSEQSAKLNEPVSKCDEKLTGSNVDYTDDDILCALHFPQVADLNSRIRKLVGFFQRIKNQTDTNIVRHHQQNNEDTESVVIQSPITRYVENKTLKWTRREEADFYRVVSSFGVEYDDIEPKQEDKPVVIDSEAPSVSVPLIRQYSWLNFRQLANLPRKTDQALVEYFHSFYRMCQRVCKKPLTEFAGPSSTAATSTTSGSSLLGAEVPMDPISEERAGRCLSRIDLLARIRNKVLPHPDLNERLKLCQPSSDLPSWWIPGKHDKELLIAATKHGLARTDLNILSDSNLSFARIVQLIREKLMNDPTVTHYPGDLNANQANRSNIATAAGAAARAAAEQLLKEESDTKIKVMNKSEKTDIDQISSVMTIDLTSNHSDAADENLVVGNPSTNDQSDKILDPDGMPDIKSSLSNVDCVVGVGVEDNDEEEEEGGDTKPDPAESVRYSPPTVENNSDQTGNCKIDENSETKEVNAATAPDISIVNSIKTEEHVSGLSVSTAAEWSLKFATNLAISWPKDRTIQHRLELICETVEKNEWPNPRRYLPTPSGASIPVTSVSNLTRAQVDSKVSCFNTFPPTCRQSVSSHPDYTAHSHYTRRLAGSGTLTPLSKLPYSSNALSSEHTTALSVPTDSITDNLTDLSDSPATSNYLDETHHLECSRTSERLSHPRTSKLSLHSYSPDTQSPVSTIVDSDDATFSSTTVVREAKDDLSNFGVSIPSEHSATKSRGRSRSKSVRSANQFNQLEEHADLEIEYDFSSEHKSPTNIVSDSDIVSKHRETTKSNFIVSSACSVTSANNNGFSMPPPSMTVTPRSVTGTVGRGRKRKGEPSKSRPDLHHPVSKTHNPHKRERFTQNTEHDEVSQSSDVWDIHVPVISLVDGSLIYGNKAPRRRALEAWLEANPSYMPYSVEAEDRAIYTRVAASRGQDATNMELLAYKHYLNSLLANATTNMNTGNVVNNANPIPTIQNPLVNQANNSTFNNQQLLQQQQLLTAFGNYARHPAYANFIASTLGSIPAENTSSRLPFTVSTPTTSTSRSSRSRNSANRSDTYGNNASSSGNSRPSSSSDNCSSGQTDSTGICTNPKLEAMLTAVYQQAAAMNLAYMCNPLAAAAVYSQMMLACSGLTNTPEPNITTNSTVPPQQMTLASLYANYLLSAKQMQQRQQLQQQCNQQQLASLAASLAAVCGTNNTVGEIDSTALLSLLSGSVNSSQRPASGCISNELGSSTQLTPSKSNASVTNNVVTDANPSKPDSIKEKSNEIVSGSSTFQDETKPNVDQTHAALDLSR